MRTAALLYGQEDIRIEELPDPPFPGPLEVQLRPIVASLCGSDVSLFCHPGNVPLIERHPNSTHRGPFILGHEFVAEVVQLGAHVQHAFSLGQRVVPGARWWCNACSACKDGNIHLCENDYVFGLHAHGGLVQGCINVPAKMCIPVPNTVSDDAAAMAQPCAIAMHAVKTSRASVTSHVVLFGLGGIGTPILSMLKARGVNSLLVVDVNDDRLEKARALGATTIVNGATDDVLKAIRHFTDDLGADLIVECTGVSSMPALALRSVRRGGRIHLIGIQNEVIPFDFGTLVRNEVQLSTSNGLNCLIDLPDALRHLAQHPDLIEHMRGNEVTLDSLVQEGILPMVERRTQGKVLVKLQ